MDPQPLVNTLRAWLEGATPSAKLPGGVTALAGRHRLNGTLYHIGADLSESDAAKAAESWSQNLAGHLARGEALASIWPESAPPPLVFKGADLAENLFEYPCARASNDLDLLLPEPAHAAAWAALSPGIPRRAPPRGERFAGEPPYAVGLEVGPVLIELHRDPLPPHLAGLDGESVYGRSESGRLGELDVRYPRALDRLLLWLANQAKGAFFCDLAAWLDLALILRAQTQLDLARHHPSLRSAAQAVGLANAYDLALFRLADAGLWPGTVPRSGRPGVKAANALLPPVLASVDRPPTARLQGVKIWLCRPRARLGLLARAGVSLLRGQRPGVANGREDA